MRWPANRLTYGQMQTLRKISKDVRLPINQLLKDAVDVYLIVLRREMQAVMVAEQVDDNVDASDRQVSVSDRLAVAESGAVQGPDDNSPTD